VRLDQIRIAGARSLARAEPLPAPAAVVGALSLAFNERQSMRPESASNRPITTGDRVQLRKDGAGTVVAVIDERSSGTPPELYHWRRLGRGIVVRLDSGTLVHIREPLFELVPSEAPTAAEADPPKPTVTAPR
jgi:hypothetical protein